MTKKLKLSLDELSVQSFVTALGNDRSHLLGGSDISEPPICDTNQGYTCNFKCGDTQWWECETINGPGCSANCYTFAGGEATCGDFCTGFCSADGGCSKLC